MAGGVALGLFAALLSGHYLIALPIMAAGVLMAVLVPTRSRQGRVAQVVDGGSSVPATILFRYFHGALQDGDLDAADEVFSHSHIYSDPDGRPFAIGPTGMKDIARLFRSAIPDPQVTVSRLMDDEGVVTVAFRVIGELHDGSRITSIPLRWECRIAARQVVSTTGELALISRLAWMTPPVEDGDSQTDATVEMPVPRFQRRPRPASHARRRVWFE